MTRRGDAAIQERNRRIWRLRRRGVRTSTIARVFGISAVRAYQIVHLEAVNYLQLREVGQALRELVRDGEMEKVDRRQFRWREPDCRGGGYYGA